MHGGQGESTATCVEIRSQWKGKAQNVAGNPDYKLS